MPREAPTQQVALPVVTDDELAAMRAASRAGFDEIDGALERLADIHRRMAELGGVRSP